YPTKDLSPKVLKIIQDYVQYSGANPHAHNLIFQLFNNYGFLGVLSYSLLSLYLSILLIKSFLKKKVSVFILIPLSALLSVFMQELFDYTIPDSIIFYLVIVLLGILAASYRSKIIYTVTLSLNPYVRKITLTGLFIFMFTSFLLSYNYQLADQIENLFYKEIQHDNFHNFRFRVPLAASPNVKKFIQLDKKYLPLRVDEKRELFTGEIYLELSREGLPFLKKAEDRFLRCVKLNPRSAFCYRELSEIARMNKEEEKAGQLLDKYKALDPLHLIK
ncbi:MAG: hypothetical protein KDK45_19835, partial [Leptospiraceae bacterium]|nr:hypothetical protein [Leptospiraceae bacterium]